MSVSEDSAIDMKPPESYLGVGSGSAASRRRSSTSSTVSSVLGAGGSASSAGIRSVGVPRKRIGYAERRFQIGDPVIVRLVRGKTHLLGTFIHMDSFGVFHFRKSSLNQ